MQPGLGAVIFLTFCILIVFSCGAFLVYRVMTRPGTHIGSRLPRYDPDDPVDPQSDDPGAEATPGTEAGRDDGEGPRRPHP